MSFLRYALDTLTRGPGIYIFEPSDPRLGRHQYHDPRSRLHDARRLARQAGTPQSPVVHARHAPIWDQGDIGDCTANACLGMLMTEPFYNGTRTFTEADCVEFYSYETRIDNAVIPGAYPPDDTGSTGLFSMKAARSRGYITGYRHAFSLADAVALLGRQPISVGIPWLESMFDTDGAGNVVVAPGSPIAGGHQIVFDAVDPTSRRLRFANSWGTSWGDHGWGWITYGQLGALLRRGGDVVTAVI